MPQPTNWSGKDCKGTPPTCGHIAPDGALVKHNHHTPPSHAWGETWAIDEMTDALAMDGETLEEHIAALLAAFGDLDNGNARTDTD